MPLYSKIFAYYVNFLLIAISQYINRIILNCVKLTIDNNHTESNR